MLITLTNVIFNMKQYIEVEKYYYITINTNLKIYIFIYHSVYNNTLDVSLLLTYILYLRRHISCEK